MSARETISNIPQNSDNLPELLRAFLDTHDLGLEQLAGCCELHHKLWRHGLTKAWHRPRASWPSPSLSIAGSECQAVITKASGSYCLVVELS